SSILGNANGAYASSNNQIYLSANFLATSTAEAISAVLLEEIGHFIDGHINISDSAGDEGAIFAELVQGNSLDTQTLQALKAEDDHATITVNGQNIQVEQQNFTGTAGDDTITGTSEDDNIYGQDGNDTLNAGHGRDRLEGGDGDDVLSGGAGDDGFYYGQAGLFGGNGNDILNGEAGNDELYGHDGNDILNGGSEDDYIDGGAGSDTIDGGSGNDTLKLDYSAQITPITITYTDTQVVASGGGDTFKAIEGVNLLSGSGADNLNFIATSLNSNIQGGGGNDFIALGSADDLLYGQDGNDTLNAGHGRDRLEGGDGDDVLSGGAGDDGFYYGQPGLFGGNGNDTLNGEAGNDELYGHDGNDILNGGSEDDYLDGGAGSDTIDGGSGNDTLKLDYSAQITPITITYTDTQVVASGGGDTFKAIEGVNLLSGSGADNLNFIATSLNSNIQGGGGNDFIAVGSADDRLYGQDGNDTLNAGNGRDRLEGGSGDDVLSGGAGSDGFYHDQGLFGGDGNDILNGEAGNDQLYGEGGNDTLQGTNGGAGEYDYLNGGSGSDLFILGHATWIGYDDGNSTTSGDNDYADIAEFNADGGDVIQLQGTSSNYLLTVVGADTQILINKPGTETDEIIGIVRNQTGLSLTGSSFAYVSLSTITLAVAPTSVLEDGTTNLVYTFTRTGITTNALTVNYGITGTANSTDYTGATPGTGKTITFAAGASTATLTIDPTADTTIEANETVVLTLVAGTGYNRGTTTAVTGTITNDDPTITLAVAPSSVTEDGTTNLVYTFTRTGITTNALTVNYSINGTADSTDYTGATPGTGKTITFAAGASTATLTIDPTADTTIESDETVALTLVAGTGYTRGTTTAVTGTITNDDPTITLAVVPTSVTEDGTTNLVYTFTRTGITTNALTVNYSINGTADSTDYTGATPGTGKTITFDAGASTATLTIDPTADNTTESNDTVAITLAAGTDYTLGTTTAVTGTIVNDDFGTISINDITVVEGKDANAFLTVSLSNPNTQPISVNYTITPVNATANVDYTSVTGTLTIAANTSFDTISIPILNDNLNEPDEAFTVNLSNPINAPINPNAGIGEVIITDTWESTLTRILPAGVENLKLIGSAAINGTGNAGNNVLTGNSANNTLIGLNGNDTYSFVANSSLGIDTIIETTTGGIDTIDFSGTTVAVNVNLGITTSQTVNSNLKLILSANNVIENATGGTANNRLTGNTLNNTLNGGSGNDQLQGLGGDDTLWGEAGNDILNGGTGNDSLWGGLGDDILTGGVGNDQYLFQSDSVFSTSLGVDYISEFEAGLDQIVLSKATFNAITNLPGQDLTDFEVVGGDEFVNASNARIVFSQGTGSLFYNQDGSILGTGTVFEFARLGNPDITLTSSNFSLIA
ncbi:beta strand repeat-containing protein, partial [Dolichospermum circinale]|uniref:beta strand repeat-containing protein n=1 Tax=Dolichospermum circinale TaxID=109265 RepID=UPI002FEE0A82